MRGSLAADNLQPPRAALLDGWEPRFIGSEPRLSEVAGMYREIGFEVMIVPFDPVECEGCCKECFSEGESGAMVVYTKK